MPTVRYLIASTLLAVTIGGHPALAKRGPAWPWASRAIAKLAAGDPVTAVRMLTKAKNLGPNPRWNVLVALAALEGNRSKDALRILNQITTKGFSNPWALYWQGRSAWLQKKRKLAFDNFSDAIGLGGAEPAQYMGLALMALQRKKKKVALDALVEVAKQTPNLMDPKLYPSPAEGAIYLLPQVLPKGTTLAKVRRTQAFLLAQRDRALQALELSGPVLKAQPRDPELLLLVAKLRSELGQASAAAKALDAALAIAPSSGPGLHLRGLRRVEANQLKPAIADLKKAADRLPRDGALLCQLGRACLELGDLGCAGKYLGYAIKQAPSLADAHFALAEYSLKRGLQKEAASSYAQALQLNAANPAYYLAAAHLARLQDKPRQARTLLAAERKVRRLSRSYVQKSKLAEKSRMNMLAALKACGCDGSTCRNTQPGCEKPLASEPLALRAFFQAHLAIVAGDLPRARSLLAKIIPKLRISKLFDVKAKLLQLDFRRDKRTHIQVRKSLSMVPPWTFR